MTLRLVTGEETPEETGEVLVVEYDSSVYTGGVRLVPTPGSGVVRVIESDGTSVASALLSPE